MVETGLVVVETGLVVVETFCVQPRLNQKFKKKKKKKLVFGLVVV